MTERRAVVETFDVDGDGAYAWYFVMAHWPNPETSPQLRLGPGPMQLVLETTAENLYALRCTLKAAIELHGAVAESARGLLNRLEASLPKEPPGPMGAGRAG
jgi:hypothetical protein